MKNLYEAISGISAELNEISKENIPTEIRNLKYRGDNANFSITIRNQGSGRWGGPCMPGEMGPDYKSM